MKKFAKMADLKCLFALFLLVSYAGLVHCLDEEHCKCRIQAGSRIIGGQIARETSYPWMASIAADGYHKGVDRSHVDDKYKVENGHFCGATIINERWLLTAAHCTNKINTFSVGFGNGNDLVKIFDSGRIKVKQIIDFPHFGRESMLSDDISLLELEEPINFTSTVLPACLGVDYKSKEKRILFAAGFGITNHYKLNLTSGLYYADAKLHRYLKEVVMEDASETEELCHREPKKLCANNDEGEGTCNGDSGGPIHFVTNGRAHVVGVTSLSNGFKRSETEKNILNYCGKGGYQRVGPYINFIRFYVNRYCSDPGKVYAQYPWIK